MASENTTFKHGGATYPLPSALTNTLLQDADPSLYYVLDFYAAILNTYMGTRLVAEAADCGAPITSAVAYKLPTDPADYLVEEQVQFPLLAVWRVREQLRDRTVTWRHDIAEWKVSYVLPPLSPGQRERIVPVLRSIGRILDNRTEIGYDPAYSSGAKILGASYANLETIYVTDAVYGAWEAGQQLVFPCVTLTLEVKERGASVAVAYDPITGADSHLDNVASGETTYSDLVQFQTTTG